MIPVSTLYRDLYEDRFVADPSPRAARTEPRRPLLARIWAGRVAGLALGLLAGAAAGPVLPGARRLVGLE